MMPDFSPEGLRRMMFWAGEARRLLGDICRRRAIRVMREQAKSEVALYIDIANLLAAGDHEAFNEGWPHHYLWYRWHETSFLERMAQSYN